MTRRAPFNIGAYDGYTVIGEPKWKRALSWKNSRTRFYLAVGIGFMGVLFLAFAVTRHRNDDAVEANINGNLRGDNKNNNNPYDMDVPSMTSGGSASASTTTTPTTTTTTTANTNNNKVVDQEAIEKTMNSIMEEFKDAKEIQLEEERSAASKIMAEKGLSQEILNDLKNQFSSSSGTEGEEDKEEKTYRVVTVEEIETMAKQVESNLVTHAEDLFVSKANVIVGNELEQLTQIKIQTEHEGLDTQGITDNLLIYRVTEVELVQKKFTDLLSEATDTLRANKLQEELQVVETLMSQKLGHDVHLELPTEEQQQGGSTKFVGLAEALDSLSPSSPSPDTTSSEESSPVSDINTTDTTAQQGSETTPSEDVSGDQQGSSAGEGSESESDAAPPSETSGGDTTDNSTTADENDDEALEEAEEIFDSEVRDAEHAELEVEEEEIRTELESKKDEIRNSIVGLAGDGDINDEQVSTMVEEVEEIVEEQVQMNLEAEANAEVNQELEQVVEVIEEGKSEGVVEEALEEEIDTEEAVAIEDIKSDMEKRADELEQALDSLTEAAEAQVVVENGPGSP